MDIFLMFPDECPLQESHEFAYDLLRGQATRTAYRVRG